MKKIIRIAILLLFLAAADQILIDWIANRAESTANKDTTSDLHTDTNTEKSIEKDIERQQESATPKAIQAAINEDLQIFPIPRSTLHKEYTFSYEDSWLYARTFGGERFHEGTDIMLTPDTRGLFPVLSMTDGIVEKKGWLPQGGYRIGIRSENQMYYYYAHLADYAEDLEIGVSVTAGQLLGFAGDTGYSEIEGTTGNFPVHLHVGIYYDNAQGEETAVNPYEFLLSLEKTTTKLEF